MSYTRVSAQRSNRYPLMGVADCGCGCGGSGGCGPGVGSLGRTSLPTLSAVIGGTALVGALSVGWFLWARRR